MTKVKSRAETFLIQLKETIIKLFSMPLHKPLPIPLNLRPKKFPPSLSTLSNLLQTASPPNLLLFRKPPIVKHQRLWFHHRERWSELLPCGASLYVEKLEMDGRAPR